MNLRNIANRYIQRVNPDQVVRWERSTGYVIDDYGKPVPQFTIVECPANVQPASSDMMRQINEQTDGLNISSIMRSVFLSENARGVSYRTIQGGDIFYLVDFDGDEETAWKVVRVQERWNNWAHVVVAQQ